MFYLEHLSVGSNGIVFKDKNGRSLGLGMAFRKGILRLWNYILDFELLFLRVTGFIPIFYFRYLMYVLAGVRIGRGTHIHMGAQFFDPTNIKIGSGTIVGQNAFLDGRDRLIIGNHVDIASDVLIYNSEHDINSEDFQAITAPVEIGDYVFIGPRVIILPGVKVGRGAVIAAGAVVTKDIEEFAIAGGIPARKIGERGLKEPKYNLGRARLFQ